LLLVEAAQRISHSIRPIDTVARFGGDEFIVIIRELDSDYVTAHHQARQVAEKILTLLSADYLLTLPVSQESTTQIKHHCTASIGIVLFADQPVSQEDILKWADIAMYQAKECGGNTIRFYEASLPVLKRKKT
jgi:diguanylate cyclase (GGDEF)-like protein